MDFEQHIRYPFSVLALVLGRNYVVEGHGSTASYMSADA